MRLRPLWIWEKEEEQFYKSKCIGTVVHVCCGRSTFGDLRIDKYEKTADMLADYRRLPIPDKSYDTALCDPYWGKKEQVDLGLSWLHELRRVARKRIIIVHNTLFTIKGCKLVEAWAVNTKGIFWKVMAIYDIMPNIDQFIGGD